MDVRVFHPEDHLHILRRWLTQRALSLHVLDELPVLGFISFSHDEPIAAAFLRRLEPNHAQLDGLITNVLATSLERHHGIDLVVGACIGKATQLKLKQIVALSVDEGTLQRSEKHRFVKLPHTVIALNLGGHDGICR